VAREEEKLKLGKGSAFEKSRFKRLRQDDETWEADFQALPKPMTPNETYYLGMVVAPHRVMVGCCLMSQLYLADVQPDRMTS
jgi:hypothetical protein